MRILTAVVAAAVVVCLPLAAQQRVPLVLHSLVLTLDSATYKDVLHSDFMRNQFSAVESDFLSGIDGGFGLRLFGKYNFVKFGEPQLKSPATAPGYVGIILAVEGAGGLNQLKTQGPFGRGGGLVSISNDGPVHANEYVESSTRLRPTGPDSLSDRVEFEIMQYTTEAAKARAQTDSLPVTDLSMVRFLRRYFDPAKLFSYISGATLAIPVDDIAKIEAVLKRDNVPIVAEGEGAIIRLTGFTLHLVPPFRGAGVKQLQFALTRPVLGNPNYHFGPKSELRFGPGPIAVWDFESK